MRRQRLNRPVLGAGSLFLLILILIISKLGFTQAPSGIVIYGDQGVHLRKGSTTSEGSVGSGANLQLGQEALISGDVFALGDLIVLKDGLIDGDATLGGLAFLGRGADVTGILLERSATLPSITIPTFEGTPGDADVFVPKDGSKILTEGSYNEVHVQQNGSLTLTGGRVDLNTFIVGKDATIVIEGPVLIVP